MISLSQEVLISPEYLTRHPICSRSHPAADPRGSGAYRERQRVRAEDQHRHREDLHPPRLQLLRRGREGARRVSGNVRYYLDIEVVKRVEMYFSAAVKFHF